MGAHKLGEGQVDLSSNSYGKFPNTKEFPENHRHRCHAKLRQDVLNVIGRVGEHKGTELCGGGARHEDTVHGQGGNHGCL